LLLKCGPCWLMLSRRRCRCAVIFQMRRVWMTLRWQYRQLSRSTRLSLKLKFDLCKNAGGDPFSSLKPNRWVWYQQCGARFCEQVFSVKRKNKMTDCKMWWRWADLWKKRVETEESIPRGWRIGSGTWFRKQDDANQKERLLTVKRKRLVVAQRWVGEERWSSRERCRLSGNVELRTCRQTLSVGRLYCNTRSANILPSSSCQQMS